MGRNWWKRPCSFIGHAMGTIFHCMILGAVFHNILVFMGTWSQAIKLIYSCAKKRSVWDHNVTHMHSLSLHVSESVTIRSKQRLVGWLQSSWRRGIDISDLGVFPLYPSFLLSPHEDPGTVRDEQSCTCRANLWQHFPGRRWPNCSGTNSFRSPKKMPVAQCQEGKKQWMYITFCILPSHLQRCFFNEASSILALAHCWTKGMKPNLAVAVAVKIWSCRSDSEWNR